MSQVLRGGSHVGQLAECNHPTWPLLQVNSGTVTVFDSCVGDGRGCHTL